MGTEAHLGYEGLAQIGDYVAVGSGASMPRAPQRLVSSAGYGGTINGNDRAIGSPYNYDWEQWDGNINFEVNPGILGMVLRWVYDDRQGAKRIGIYPRASEQCLQVFNQAWWTSVSFSTSDGSFVDGAVNFMAVERDEYSWGGRDDNYKTGRKSVYQGEGGCDSGGKFPGFLNKEVKNVEPVPFWNTAVSVVPYVGSEMDWEVTDWNLSFTQEMVKFFTCENEYKGPSFVAAGPMSLNVTGTWVGPREWVVQNGGLGIKLREMRVVVPVSENKGISLQQLRANNENDPVRGQNEVTAIDFEYEVFGLSLFGY